MRSDRNGGFFFQTGLGAEENQEPELEDEADERVSKRVTAGRVHPPGYCDDLRARKEVYPSCTCAHVRARPHSVHERAPVRIRHPETTLLVCCRRGGYLAVTDVGYPARGIGGYPSPPCGACALNACWPQATHALRTTKTTKTTNPAAPVRDSGRNGDDTSTRRPRFADVRLIREWQLVEIREF